MNTGKLISIGEALCVIVMVWVAIFTYVMMDYYILIPELGATVGILGGFIILSLSVVFLALQVRRGAEAK